MTSGIPIEYEWFLNRSIWHIDETLTGTTTSGKSGPGNNVNEEEFLNAFYVLPPTKLHFIL